MQETNTTRRDCFAYADRKCKALKERVCDRGKCNFFKTKEAFEAGFSEEQLRAYSAKKNNS